MTPWTAVGHLGDGSRTMLRSLEGRTRPFPNTMCALDVYPTRPGEHTVPNAQITS